jgi:outer membrane protein TolC
LRNFGETVTLSQIKLAQIAQNQAKEDLIEAINTAVSETEKAYFDLGLQWKTLQVKLWLLEEGEAVVEVLRLRMGYDTGDADYAQAAATVQQRRAEVISQQSLVHRSSDALKKLINTNTLPIESEEVIVPTGSITANQVSISLRQAIVTALERRPDLRKLAMTIDSESINMKVADNALLPQLDMQAQMSFYGLGDTAGDGYQEVFDGDYLNYVLGLKFSVPLGNRAAKAMYQSSRLQQMSAVAAYKQAVQQTLLDVKNALRDIVTNNELIQANASYRIAQTENMRALAVEEETMAGLTPTFLNLKLQTQVGVANARIAEFGSIVNYNKAIVSLNKAMGTTLDTHQVLVIDESPQTKQ